MLDGNPWTANQLHQRLPAFLASLENLSAEETSDAFTNEVIETGGTYVPHPDDPDDWASHLFEVCLHGVNAYGWTEAEAICNWKRAASALASADQS